MVHTSVPYGTRNPFVSEFEACIFGLWAFVKRQIGSYMLLRNQFVFFDFDEPLVFFLADYIAIMGLFVMIGHYFSEGLRRIVKKRKEI